MIETLVNYPAAKGKHCKSALTSTMQVRYSNKQHLKRKICQIWYYWQIL